MVIQTSYIALVLCNIHTTGRAYLHLPRSSKRIRSLDLVSPHFDDGLYMAASFLDPVVVSFFFCMCKALLAVLAAAVDNQSPRMIYVFSGVAALQLASITFPTPTWNLSQPAFQGTEVCTGAF